MERIEEREEDASPEAAQDLKDPRKYIPHELTTLEQSGVFPKGWLDNEDPKD